MIDSPTLSKGSSIMSTPSNLPRLLAGCALLLAVHGMTQAAPALIVSGPSTVAQGAVLKLSVDARDVSDLAAYQFDLVFDPGAFTALAVEQGPFLPTQGATFFDGGTIDNVSGRISFVFDTLVGPAIGASGAGSLAFFDFRSVAAPGTSGTFRLENLVALDSVGAELSSVTAQALQVSAVPEPAAWQLAMAGMVALLWRRLVTNKS